MYEQNDDVKTVWLLSDDVFLVLCFLFPKIGQMTMIKEFPSPMNLTEICCACEKPILDR